MRQKDKKVMGEGWKAKKGPIIVSPFQNLITKKYIQKQVYLKQTNKQKTGQLRDKTRDNAQK